MNSTPSESIRHLLPEVAPLHPADLADRLQRLPVSDARALLTWLPPRQAAAALVELDKDRATEVIAQLLPLQLAGLLQHTPPQQAVDVLQELPIAFRRDVLAALPPEVANSIRSLLRYPEDTAGGAMSNRFIALREDLTVHQVRDLLRSHGESERSEEVAYLYVTDHDQRLVGIVSLRDLIFRRSDRRMSELMNREVKSVRVDTDQEALARQFEHYHFLGLPVLDNQGRLVGVVKASDALDIARDEATEDMQLMVGLSGEERALTPWHKSIGRRLPWLYLNLATAFAAAAVVSHFENTIARWTALAVFLPIIAGQGGNAGMQTLTIIIRDLALGELPAGEGRQALRKELTLGILNGLAIGLVVGLIAWLWKTSPALGVVAGAAMLLNQIAAALSGVMIPLGLRWLRVDPALASSILLTTVTDVAGFLIFLSLAATVLQWIAA